MKKLFTMVMVLAIIATNATVNTTADAKTTKKPAIEKTLVLEKGEATVVDITKNGYDLKGLKVTSSNAAIVSVTNGGVNHFTVKGKAIGKATVKATIKAKKGKKAKKTYALKQTVYVLGNDTNADTPDGTDGYDPTPVPTQAPVASVTPVPWTPAPTETPAQTQVPTQTVNPAPTKTPSWTNRPIPTAVPTQTPAQTSTPTQAPTMVPQPTAPTGGDIEVPIFDEYGNIVGYYVVHYDVDPSIGNDYLVVGGTGYMSSAKASAAQGIEYLSGEDPNEARMMMNMDGAEVTMKTK